MATPAEAISGIIAFYIVDVKNLPTTLREALNELESDRVIRDALGEHIYQHYLEAKRAEWKLYAATVHDWELKRYLELM